jgi:hypothetical protein
MPSKSSPWLCRVQQRITNAVLPGLIRFLVAVTRVASSGRSRPSTGTERPLMSTPGWVARLKGHNFDLAAWECCLASPFDPHCERIPQDGQSILVLRSLGFSDGTGVTAETIRQLAIPLIDRLNGVMGVMENTETVKFDGVGRIDEHGQMHTTFFAEMHARARATATATGVALDANGNIIPPPPPVESATQRIIHLAENNDDIADLLMFASRADNWFDIYKAIEVAERLAGGTHRLWPLLGNMATQCQQMRRTANFHRHSSREQPPILTPIGDAKSLLAFIFRTIISPRIS